FEPPSLGDLESLTKAPLCRPEVQVGLRGNASGNVETRNLLVGKLSVRRSELRQVLSRGRQVHRPLLRPRRISHHDGKRARGKGGEHRHGFHSRTVSRCASGMSRQRTTEYLASPSRRATPLT